MDAKRRRVGCRLGAVLALITLTSAMPAAAEEPPQHHPPAEPAEGNGRPGDDELDSTVGTLSLVIENDYFANTDRNYTNGLRLAYLRPEGSVNDLTAWLGRTVLGIEDRRQLYEGLAIGQNLFTPSDITVAAPQPGDHPYAGWLYLELAALADRDTSVDTLTLNAGIVGPLALGEFTQNTFHRWIDSEKAEGWGNQLSNEPGFVVSFDRAWRVLRETRAYGFDLVPSVGVSLGNVLTQAHGGLTLRIGPDLGDDLGPPRIRPSLAGGGFLGTVREFDFYFFAGIQGAGVARNIFLDGNTFADSLSVEKRNLIFDAQLGLVIRFQGLRLSYTFVRRSRTFEGQEEPHLFGALSLTTRF